MRFHKKKLKKKMILFCKEHKEIIVNSFKGTLLAVLLVAFISIMIVVAATRKNIDNYIHLPFYKLPESLSIDVDSSERYLGQADLILTKTGKFITVYPNGHGHGEIYMKTSQNGKDWAYKTDTPSSWKDSQETPTIYTLDFNNGTQILILISGKPYWVMTKYKADGFQYSISYDDGEKWTEFQKAHSPFDCIVAMSSLTKLKENGEFVDKWMGTFHTHEFINYKTILSFDENGKVIWSEPEPIFEEKYRNIEKSNGLCEIEIIRHNEELILMARNEVRGGKASMISISKDEGKTWTQPRYLPLELTGDRFAATYDNLNNKILISYRQIIPYKEHALAFHKYMSYGWVLWVGDIETLENYAEPNEEEKEENKEASGYLVLLGSDPSGDCGYSGIISKDGIVYSTAYGKFNDQPINSIRGVCFKLEDVTKSFEKILN